MDVLSAVFQAFNPRFRIVIESCSIFFKNQMSNPLKLIVTQKTSTNSVFFVVDRTLQPFIEYPTEMSKIVADNDCQIKWGDLRTNSEMTIIYVSTLIYEDIQNISNEFAHF